MRTEKIKVDVVPDSLWTSILFQNVAPQVILIHMVSYTFVKLTGQSRSIDRDRSSLFINVFDRGGSLEIAECATPGREIVCFDFNVAA
jgi:hypothetical protein